MKERIDEGTVVRWTWGDGTATGTVREVFERRVCRTIKGTEVVRDATPGAPAYLIEQDDGDVVLKSASEIEQA